MFTTMHTPDRGRRNKTNIIRTRTGCQNCRKRRRKCDEDRPECQACVKRGIKCSGYERTIAFKDVSDLAAESSRKFEAARWAALRAEDEQQIRRRRRARSRLEPVERAVETLSSNAASDSGSDGDRSSSSPGPGPLLNLPSPRQHRRAPPATRQQSHWFEVSENQLPPLDPVLYQSSNLDASPSFELLVQTTPSPPVGSTTALTTYNNSLQGPLPPLHESPAREVSLLQHFENHVLPNLPVPMAFGRSYMSNPCFRNAVLALSSANQSYLQSRTEPGQSDPKPHPHNNAVGREYYLAAVSELYRSLDLSDPVASEQHAAAALMLAYYEIETGSCFGSLRHARGLDALLSRLDHAPAAMPDIFKAWRLLRYDVRFISASYRRSTVQTDAHDAYAAGDPQLAVRDVYTAAWSLAGRVLLEASFAPDPAKGSRSRQVAVWIRDVAGRVCDRRNVEKGDYHRDEITPEEVVAQCGRFARALDRWHANLAEADRPVVRAGTGSPFVSGGPGAAFEPIMVLDFAGGDRRAFEYMMYAMARLGLSYLLSVFGDGRGGGGGGSATETAAWAKMVFGIVCGMRHKQSAFSYVTAAGNVWVAAMLCEGVEPVNAVLEGVIPHVLGLGIATAELAEWLYVKKVLEIVRREKMRGRSIRTPFLTLDDDYEKGQFDTSCLLIAFGDHNGKGHFRDVYRLDGDV